MKLSLWLILFTATPGLAQTAIDYRISFVNRDHHEANVQVTFTEVSADTLAIRMSRSSPGRYALHEFAKNIYAVQAEGSKGQKLEFHRPNPHQWSVYGHDGTVKISYTIFGDLCDGTYLAIDNTHAHLNMPATFMWAAGLEDRPIQIVFELPRNDWRIATQLHPTTKPNRFTAPDLQYFLDSPTEVSDFDLADWQVQSGGLTQRIRLALHHEGSTAETAAYARLCEAVVQEQIAIYGELPLFENGTYTFIADYLAGADNDGMEHRNSTVCTSSRALTKHFIRTLSTISHELFHCWNVERIRPKSLEPFNFSRTNISGELWFAEGFTSYYDGLALKRAQLVSIDWFANDISRNLDFVLTSPGNRFFSPIEMSLQAPFTDAGVANDPQNFKNTFISYYPYGSALGLALDLLLRTHFKNISLDDLMRVMWHKYGRREIPYSNKDIKTTLAEITISPEFSENFFKKYVEGRDWPDYKNLLEHAGFLLRKKKPGEAWFGPLNFKFKDGKMLMAASTLIGTPLYQAGIDRNDVIMQLAGENAPADTAALETLLAKFNPGKEIDFVFKKRGETRTTKITLEENPTLEVVLFEQAGLKVTDNMAQFRKNWLGRKSDADKVNVKRHCPKCKRAFDFQFEYCRFDGEKLGLTAK